MHDGEVDIVGLLGWLFGKKRETAQFAVGGSVTSSALEGDFSGWTVERGQAARNRAVNDRIVGTGENFDAVCMTPPQPGTAKVKISGAIRCHGCGKNFEFDHWVRLDGGSESGVVSCSCGAKVTWMAAGREGRSYLVVQPFTASATGGVSRIAFMLSGIRVDSASPNAAPTLPQQGGMDLAVAGDDKNYAFSISISRDGSRLLCGHSNGEATIWDLSTGECAARWKVLHEGIHHIAWRGDCCRAIFAGAGHSPEVVVWDLDENRSLWSGQWNGSIHGLVFLPDDVHAAAGICFEGTQSSEIRIWKLADGKIVRTLKGHRNATHLAVPRTQDRLLSGAADYSARWWKWKTGEQVGTYAAPGEINCIAESPDGKLAALALYSGDVIVLRIPGGKVHHALKGHGRSVNTACFAQAGKTLCSASRDGTVRCWSLATGQQIAQWPASEYAELAAAPDGRRVVFSVGNGVFRVRDLA
jgi:hypothetical protein